MYIQLFSCTFNWVAWFWGVLSMHCSNNVHVPQCPKTHPDYVLLCWIVDAVFSSTAGPHFLLEEHLHSLLGTQTCCIRVCVCVSGEEFLLKTMWHLDRQMSVRKRKRCTGVCPKSHSKAEPAPSRKPQGSNQMPFIILSLPPSKKRYMQLWEEYF